MNNCSKLLLTIGLAVSLHSGLYPTTDVAIGAIAPVVNTLPAITAEVSTPVRLATDSSGNIYATDPRARGILKYNSAGNLVQKIVTPKSGAGVAIAQNGNLLVTQENYVVVISPTTGNEISRFGTFLFANGIAIDSGNNIYVTDSVGNNVKKFDSNYNLLATSIVALARPSGIAYDKFNNRLAIANTYAGNIKFISPADLTLISTVFVSGTLGTRGYDSARASTIPRFMHPQGVSLEYNAISGALERIYVVETYQANIQVLDGITGSWLADIGGHGFVNGKLFAPSDVLLDQHDQANKRVFVANGGGTIALYAIDYVPPTTTYGLSLATIGDGTINGSTAPSGVSVSCGANATCPQTLISNSDTVNLIATSSVGSTFSSWSGVTCSGTNTNTICQFPMDSAKSVTATFIAVVNSKPFNVNGQYFDDLQAAYNAASDGSVIKVMSGPQSANSIGAFTADHAITVTIKGGYDSVFTEQPAVGNTIISGRINVKAGKVIMNSIRTK